MALDPATKKWLKQTCGTDVLFQEAMSRHTYFRVGGPADAFIKPENTAQLTALVEWLRAGGVPYLVIGSGTNLLVKDGGFRGVVISTQKCFRPITCKEETGGAVLVKSDAGMKLQALCRYAVDKGLGGLNFALGIPGTVGGAVAMNAGTKYGCIADVLETVSLLDPGANRIKISRKNLRFSYRSLDWGALIEGPPDAQPIILTAEFRLHLSNGNDIRKTAERIEKERRQSQPAHVPSAGCFFKNPGSGKSAGQLIDMAGLKGRRIGDAQVSTAHANFIVNRGAATAGDILQLKDIIQETVFNKFQIKLETEVKIVGTST